MWFLSVPQFKKKQPSGSLVQVWSKKGSWVCSSLEFSHRGFGMLVTCTADRVPLYTEGSACCNLPPDLVEDWAACLPLVLLKSLSHPLPSQLCQQWKVLKQMQEPPSKTRVTKTWGFKEADREQGGCLPDGEQKSADQRAAKHSNFNLKIVK